MFTIEIKINGAMIGHIYGQNKGSVGDGEYEYCYEYYEPDNKINLQRGTVRHKRSDGIKELVKLILEDLK